MKKRIQRGFCTGGFCLNGESEDSLASCLRAIAREEGQTRAKGSRGAEESDTQRQPLREPWGKVSPPLSHSLVSIFLFSSTFVHLWEAISLQPGSSPYPFWILTESTLTASHRNCTLMYLTHIQRLKWPLHLSVQAYSKQQTEFENVLFIKKNTKTNKHKEAGQMPETAGLRSDTK